MSVVPYHVRTDTLAYLKAQPLFHPASQRAVMLPTVGKLMESYLISCGTIAPEKEAIDFYAGNAIWAELVKRYAPDEPLPQAALDFARAYVADSSDAAQRLLYYMLLIITRESRHCGQGCYPQMKALHGDAFVKLNKAMHGHGSMEAKSIFLSNVPNMALGDFVDAISWTFHHAAFGAGYGGKKWAVIADVLKKLVDGEFSPEMVTDVAWALCHNGGPIFNKEMTYKHYHKESLKLILDVQRSGQVPEMIMDPDSLMGGYVTNRARAYVTFAAATMAGSFGGYVDWFKVEAAGSLQKYPAQKQGQLMKYGASTAPVKPKVAGTVHQLFWVTPEAAVAMTEKKRAA